MVIELAFNAPISLSDPGGTINKRTMLNSGHPAFSLKGNLASLTAAAAVSSVDGTGGVTSRHSAPNIRYSEGIMTSTAVRNGAIENHIVQNGDGHPSTTATQSKDKDTTFTEQSSDQSSDDSVMSSPTKELQRSHDFSYFDSAKRNSAAEADDEKLAAPGDIWLKSKVEADSDIESVDGFDGEEGDTEDTKDVGEPKDGVGSRLTHSRQRSSSFSKNGLVASGVQARDILKGVPPLNDSNKNHTNPRVPHDARRSGPRTRHGYDESSTSSANHEAVTVANTLAYFSQWRLVKLVLLVAYTQPTVIVTGIVEPVLFPIIVIVLETILRSFNMLYEAIFIGLIQETICKRFFKDVYWAMTCYCDENGNSLPMDRIPRHELIKRTLNSQTVKKAVGFVRVSAIQEKMEGGTKVYNPERMRRAALILDSMCATPSIVWMRVFAYFLRKTWKIMFPLTGIPVSEAHIRKIVEAQKKGSVLLLPTHKSHVDYMIMVYICFTYGIRLPKVVAGENLNIPIIGPLLRRGGAFYIRRTFTNDTDPLYAAVFNAYIEQLVVAGENLECFIEGGRSRSGKALAPRIGVLRIVLGTAIEQNVGKVTLVPISISYDRIVENESHVDELSGHAKKKERLFDAVGNTITTIMWAVNSMGLYGEVNVTFGQHLNLQTFVDHHREKKDIMQRKTRNMLAYRCGYRVLYEAYKCGQVLLSSMVCTVLLGHYQRGMSEEKLLREVKWLSEKVVEHGGQVKQYKARDVEIVINTVFEGRKDSPGFLNELVLNAFSSKDCDNNNGLVKRHKDLLMVELYSPKERMELSVYRNQIIHYFVEDCIVACAVYKHLKFTNEHANAGIPIDELIKDSRFLTRLFKREFIYKPAAEKRDGDERGYVVDKIIARMEKADILKIVPNNSSKEGDKVVMLNGANNREYLFLASLLWHMIDSYWLAALSLYSLFNLKEKAIREDKLLTRIQTIGERLYFEGQMDLYEAISKETLANALERFSGSDPYFKVKAIQFIHVEGGMTENVKGKRVIKLAADMDEAALDQFCAGLMLYRKSVRAYRSQRYRIHMNKGQFYDSKAIVMNMDFKK